MSYIPKVDEMSERPIIHVSGNRFQISDSDRGKLITAKKKHRKILQKRYGAGWKKHLNVPEKTLASSAHWTF